VAGPTVDVVDAGSARVGDARGVTRVAWRALAARGTEIAREAAGADAAGLLPHLSSARSPGLAADAVSLAAAWAAWPRLVLLGDAGVVSAVRCGGPADRIVDPADASPEACAGAALVVFSGPPWVDAVVADLAEAAGHVWVVTSDGTGDPPLALDGATVVAAPGAADARFAATSVVAVALAVRGGADAGVVCAALAAAAAACSVPTRRENAALEMASIATALWEGPAVGAPTLLVPAGLARWAAHAARVWGAFTCRARAAGPGLVAPVGLPGVLVRTDEAGASALLGGPREQWCVRVEPRGLSGAVVAAGAVAGGWRAALLAAGVPSVRLTLPGGDAAARLAGMLVWTHAALLAALHLGLEPLALPAADRLREVQRERTSDSHGRAE
jgi:hypothetical protein